MWRRCTSSSALLQMPRDYIGDGAILMTHRMALVII
jgi:hypothetical protein